MCDLVLEFKILILFHEHEMNKFLWLSIVINLQHLKLICQTYEKISFLSGRTEDFVMWNDYEFLHLHQVSLF